ncbi:MAG TPA: hypothetical protein DC042_14020 [Bacteroidales bacterium]|nr:hypothetical protein [Bacteroidales bacterium]
MMKKCTEIEILMYLTPDELSDQDKVLVDGHLTSCEECAKKRMRFLANRNILVAGKVSEAVQGQDFIRLEELVMSQIVPAVKKASPVLGLLRWTSTVAAGLLLILFLGEQAHSVRKIVRLEQTFADIEYPETPGLVDRWAIRESHQVMLAELKRSGLIHDSITSVGPFRLAFARKQLTELETRLIKNKINRVYPDRSISPFRNTAFIIKTK